MILEIEDVKGEYREGYYVCSLMKRVWLAELEILHAIDEICKRHGLIWYATWGTLLGAVRHKGFIPWDDDIDIEMPRRDYEIFRRVAPGELPGSLRLADYLTDDTTSLFLKVISSEYRYRLDPEYLQAFHGCPYQLALDIMCTDRIPDDGAEAAYMTTLAMQAYGLGQRWDTYEEAHREEQFRDLLELTGTSCPAGRTPQKHCFYLTEMLSAMYMDEACEYSGIVYYAHANPGRKIRTDNIRQVKQIPFEQGVINVPGNCEEYLEALFGKDYMTPVNWGQHSFVEEAAENLRRDLEKAGSALPEQFALAYADKEK